MLLWDRYVSAQETLSPGHQIARTADELARMVRALQQAPERAFDFETSGLRFRDPRVAPIGYSIGYLDHAHRPWVWYVPFGHRTTEEQADPSAAKRAFNDALSGAGAVLGHNVKFDLNIARAASLVVPADADIHDTLVQAHLLMEQRPLDLESVCADTPRASLWDPFEYKARVDEITQARARLHGLPWRRDRPSDGTRSYLSLYGHSEVPVGVEAEYSCRDVAHVLLLDLAQRRAAMGIGEPWGQRRAHLYRNEMRLVRALADMEWEGQPLDQQYLDTLAESYAIELDQRSRELATLFGVQLSWANPNDLRNLLFGRLGLPALARTEHGELAVDRSVLARLARLPGAPSAQLGALQEYLDLNKIYTTYTRGLAFYADPDGRVHASFRGQGTKSGRLSGSNPNLQNIPSDGEHAKAVRAAFYLPPGRCRLYGDYSQVELRMLAWTTANAALTKAYSSAAYDRYVQHADHDRWYRERITEPSVDVHAEQAIRTFGVDSSHPRWSHFRRAAKVINFGVAYGMGPQGLMTNPDLLIPEAEAVEYFQRYHASNPDIEYTKNVLFNKMIFAARHSDRGVPYFVNWAGRKVHAPGLGAADRDRARSAQRSAFASLVQGSAAELTRYSIVALWEEIRAGRLSSARITSTIHDEIQIDVDAAEVGQTAAAMRRCMEDPFRGLFGRIPVAIADLAVSFTNWAEKEHYEYVP